MRTTTMTLSHMSYWMETKRLSLLQRNGKYGKYSFKRKKFKRKKTLISLTYEQPLSLRALLFVFLYFRTLLFVCEILDAACVILCSGIITYIDFIE